MGDFAAYELLPIILNMTLTGSIVIMLVLPARLALRRAPRIYSYTLWLVALFRLLCPVTISAPVSLIPEPVGSGELVSHWEEQYTEPVQRYIHSGTPEYRAAVDAGRQPLWGDGGSYVVTGPDGLSEPETNGSTRYPVLTSLWLAGVAAMAAWGVVSLLRLRRRLVGAVSLEKGVYLADHIGTPFVLGLFRPKIYLPSALPEGERRYILLHERHHIRRLDHVVKLLAFLALCVHWFNPLVWLMFVLLGKDMEMSCDEAVMRKLGAAVRADYSASLLRLATGRKIIAGAPLAFGEGDTRERVKNVLRWKCPRLWAVLAGAVVCAAVIAACAVNPRVRATGQYASMEDYAGEAMSAETVTYTAMNETRDGPGGQDAATVLDRRVTRLNREGEVSGLAPEGTLEAWTFHYEVRLDVPEDAVSLVGGMYCRDGWFDLEGQGGHNIVALRYPDGSYDILYDAGINDNSFYGYHNSYEEAIYDWCVTENGLDLPLYVEDWRNLLDLPDGDGWGNYPVHRFDGDGWYLYAPLSAWDSVLSNDAGGAWVWNNVCGPGFHLMVYRSDESLGTQQAVAREQGLTPADSAERVWRSSDGITRYLYDDPNGGSWRIDADCSGADSGDSLYAGMAPQVLALMAESFTLDERVTASVRPG